MRRRRRSIQLDFYAPCYCVTCRHTSAIYSSHRFQKGNRQSARRASAVRLIEAALQLSSRAHRSSSYKVASSLTRGDRECVVSLILQRRNSHSPADTSEAHCMSRNWPKNRRVPCPATGAATSLVCEVRYPESAPHKRAQCVAPGPASETRCSASPILARWSPSESAALSRAHSYTVWRTSQDCRPAAGCEIPECSGRPRCRQ